MLFEMLNAEVCGRTEAVQGLLVPGGLDCSEVGQIEQYAGRSNNSWIQSNNCMDFLISISPLFKAAAFQLVAS